VLSITAAAVLAGCGGHGSDPHRNDPVTVEVNGCSARAPQALATDKRLNAATRTRLLRAAAAVSRPATAGHSVTECFDLKTETTKWRWPAEVEALAKHALAASNAR
jgi:hypothetical protein